MNWPVSPRFFMAIMYVSSTVVRMICWIRACSTPRTSWNTRRVLSCACWNTSDCTRVAPLGRTSTPGCTDGRMVCSWRQGRHTVDLSWEVPNVHHGCRHHGKNGQKWHWLLVQVAFGARTCTWDGLGFGLNPAWESRFHGNWPTSWFLQPCWWCGDGGPMWGKLVMNNFKLCHSQVKGELEDISGA